MFLLVFAPVLKLGSLKLNTSYFFILIPGILGFFHVIFKKEKNVLINNLLRILIISGLFLFIRQSLVLFMDITIFRDLFIGFTLFFSCYFYVNMYRKIYRHKFHEKIINDLCLVGFAHSLIVVATFLLPEFKAALYDYIWVTPKSMKYLLGEASGYRYQGVVQSGFSFLSSTHAFFFVLGLINFKLKPNPSISRIIKFIVYQMIIFISIILIGRTGIVVIILFYSAYLIYSILKYFKNFSISKKSLKLLPLAGLCILILTSIVDFSLFEGSINYAFEIYYTYLETGRLGTTSTDILLQNEFFLPDHPLNILFGTGNYGKSGNGIASDVGLVLFIFGSGVIGIFFAYAIYYFSAFYVYKYYKVMPLIAIFIITYPGVLVLLNLKDFYFFAMGSTQIYFLLLFTYFSLIKQKLLVTKSINPSALVK